MLFGLPVFKGKIIEPAPGKYSWSVSLEFQGMPGENFFCCKELFDTKIKAKTDMKNSMRAILLNTASAMPECFVDPSKFVDLSSGVKKPFTREDLH